MGICLCASQCERRTECLRATLYDNAKPGMVFTASLLGEICNKKTGFSEYIKEDNYGSKEKS